MCVRLNQILFENGCNTIYRLMVLSNFVWKWVQDYKQPYGVIKFCLKMGARPNGFIKFCLKMWLYQIFCENVCKAIFIKFCLKMGAMGGFIKFCLKMGASLIVLSKFAFIKFCLKMGARLYTCIALWFYQIVSKNLALSNLA